MIVRVGIVYILQLNLPVASIAMYLIKIQMRSTVVIMPRYEVKNAVIGKPKIVA